MREERSGAADSGLHLVEHQERAMACGDLAHPRQVALRWHDHAALTHDRLQEDGGRVIVDGSLYGGEIAVRHMEHTRR
ncbi:Uncharacterised protein [Mycobacteroides abscessus subsp. massiliense]|nr:Uncharacterised protein [Mycobacteroides abscessus subsp. massiliense]